MLISALVWVTLLVAYSVQAIRFPSVVGKEFLHPLQGGSIALLGISTLLMALAVLPYSRQAAWILVVAGIAWHLTFSLWHTGTLWQGGRDAADTVPTLYLPTVAGNFTSAAALGGLGCADWGWLFCFVSRTCG